MQKHYNDFQDLQSIMKRFEDDIGTQFDLDKYAKITFRIGCLVTSERHGNYRVRTK